MALQNKCEIFLNDNEILVYDSTGYYSSLTNPTGWSVATMNGGSPATATVTDSSLVSNIESIEITLDSTSFTISSGNYEAMLPTTLEYLTSPNDLVVAINANTYPDFYTDFGDLADGVHTITYTINFTTASGYTAVTYSAEVFTYKSVESDMWELFHNIAYNHNSGGNDQQYIKKALYALALFKGLEYSARTSTSNTKSLEILNTLTKVLDFNNSLSC